MIRSANIHRPAISVNEYSPGTAAWSGSPLVVQQGRFDGFRDDGYL